MTWTRVATAAVLIPFVVGLGGAGARTSRGAGAIRVFFVRRCDWPSRLSLLDCDLRTVAGVCAVAYRDRTNVPACGRLESASGNRTIRSGAAWRAGGILRFRVGRCGTDALDQAPLSGRVAGSRNQ